MFLGNRIGALLGSSFGAAAFREPERGDLLLGLRVFSLADPGAQPAATLRGRVELGEGDLEMVDRGVHPAVCFTEEGVQRMGDGFLSTLVSECGVTDISLIVGYIMANRGPWVESDHLSKRLLTEILLSVHENRPIAFDRSSREEIHLIFKLLDYLGLDQWQERLEGSLPPMPLQDTPPTVFSLDRSEEELAPVLENFRGLKCLIIRGPVSQNFLDSLPRTLRRLDLSSSDMTNRILTRKETALAAVAQDGRALRFASAELRADKEVVLVAVAQNGRALQVASAGLRGDKEVVLVAVAQNGRALEYASDGLRGDKEVVLAAVAQTGWALFAASDGLRGDKEVVMVAVAQNGMALRLASAELRANKEVVLVAVARTGSALRFASAGLTGDKEVVMTAVAQYGGALEDASDELRADEEVVMAARAARVDPFTG